MTPTISFACPCTHGALQAGCVLDRRPRKMCCTGPQKRVNHANQIPWAYTYISKRNAWDFDELIELWLGCYPDTPWDCHICPSVGVVVCRGLGFRAAVRPASPRQVVSGLVHMFLQLPVLRWTIEAAWRVSRSCKRRWSLGHQWRARSERTEPNRHSNHLQATLKKGLVDMGW